MEKLANSKYLAINLPLESQYRLAECCIKKQVNQEWFLDFLYEDIDSHEYIYDNCDITFIGNMAYIAMFSHDEKVRSYAKLFLDNLKKYYKTKN